MLKTAQNLSSLKGLFSDEQERTKQHDMGIPARGPKMKSLDLQII